MWEQYLHHITVHFPIVGSLALAAIAVLYLRRDEAAFEVLIRGGGWCVFATSSVAVVSGILVAPGWFGGDGPLDLTHHRNMGVAAYIVILTAVLAFEFGLNDPRPYLKRFAAALWIAVAFGCIGAGHYGGSAVHSDIVPWDGSSPIIQELKSDALDQDDALKLNSK